MVNYGVADCKILTFCIVKKVYKADDDQPIPNPMMTFAKAFAHYPGLLEAVKNEQFKDRSPFNLRHGPYLSKVTILLVLLKLAQEKRWRSSQSKEK